MKGRKKLNQLKRKLNTTHTNPINKVWFREVAVYPVQDVECSIYTVKKKMQVRSCFSFEPTSNNFDSKMIPKTHKSCYATLTDI